MEFNESSKSRRPEHYRVVITRVTDDTGEEEVLYDELNLTVAMLARNAENTNKIAEVLLNENMLGLASCIDSSSKFKVASNLCFVINGIKDSKMSLLEDELSNDIAGGIQ